MNNCELKKHPESNQCCCECRWQLAAHWHDNFPSADLIGYACVGFAFMEGIATVWVGDFEHGLCELFKCRHPALSALTEESLDDYAHAMELQKKLP